MKSFITLFLLLLMASCGKTEAQKQKEAFQKYTGQYKSGACGTDIIIDYDNMALTCGYVSTASEVSSCKSSISNFIAKYPGINCKAKETSGEQREVTVTQADLQGYLDKLNALQI